VISINPARIPQAPTKLRKRLGNGTNQHMIVLASGHEVRNAEASEKWKMASNPGGREDIIRPKDARRPQEPGEEWPPDSEYPPGRC